MTLRIIVNFNPKFGCFTARNAMENNIVYLKLFLINLFIKKINFILNKINAQGG